MIAQSEDGNDKRAHTLDKPPIVTLDSDSGSKEEGPSPFVRTAIVVLLLVILIVAATLITIYRPGIVGNPQDKFPVFYLVWVAAVLGSAVNMTTRDHRAVIPAGLLDRISYLAWKLLIAMTFSTFLYVAFASELLTGDTFPRFVNVKTEYSYVLQFLHECKLATNQDVAKMLVWAFIAGYLERFVPNIISRIQSDSEENH
jgi:hypothetical protein